MVDMIDKEMAGHFARGAQMHRGPLGKVALLAGGAVCAYLGARWLGTTMAGPLVAFGSAAYIGALTFSNHKNSTAGYDNGLKRSDKTAAVDAGLAGSDRLDQLQGTVGIVVGKRGKGKNDPLLKYAPESHICTLAPNRTGKGVQLVATLLAPKGVLDTPVLCVDPQLENYCITSRRRRQLGRQVVLIDPYKLVEKLAEEDPTGSLDDIKIGQRFNFLDLVPNDESALPIIDKLAIAIIPEPAGANESAKHFIDTARMYLKAGIIWICCTETGENRSLPKVCDLLFGTAQITLANLWLSRPDIGWGSEAEPGLPYQAGALFGEMADKEFSGVKSSSAKELAWARTPQMRRHLAVSDFDIRDLRRNKLDIFMGAALSMTVTLPAWYRLWTAVPIILFEDNPPVKDLLIVVDEFANLGRNQMIENAVRSLPKIGLKYWFFVQDIPAFKGLYGENPCLSILANCEVVQVLGVGRFDTQTAKMISELIGKAHHEEEQHSTNKGRSARMEEWVGNLSDGESTTVQIKEADVRRMHQILNMEAGKIYNFIGFKEGDRLPVECFGAAYHNHDDIKHLAAPNPYRRNKEAV